MSLSKESAIAVTRSIADRRVMNAAEKAMDPETSWIIRDYITRTGNEFSRRAGIQRLGAAADRSMGRVAELRLADVMRGSGGRVVNTLLAADRVRDYVMSGDMFRAAARSDVAKAARAYVEPVARAVRDRVVPHLNSVSGRVSGYARSAGQYVSDIAARHNISKDAATKFFSSRFGISANPKYDIRKIVDPASKWGKKAVEWTVAAGKWTGDKVGSSVSAVSKYSGVAADAVGNAVGNAVDRAIPYHLTKSHAISNFVKNTFSKAGAATGLAIGGAWEGASEFYKFVTNDDSMFDSPGWTSRFRFGELGSRFVAKSAEVASDWVLLGIPRLIPGVSGWLNEANDYDYNTMSANEEEYISHSDANSRMMQMGIDPRTGGRMQTAVIGEDGRATGELRDLNDEELARMAEADRYVAGKAERARRISALLNENDVDGKNLEHYLRVIKNERDAMLETIDRNALNYDEWAAGMPGRMPADAESYRAVAYANTNRKYEAALAKAYESPLAASRVNANRDLAMKVFTGGVRQPTDDESVAFDSLWEELDPADKFNFDVNKFRAGVMAASKVVSSAGPVQDTYQEDDNGYPGQEP